LRAIPSINIRLSIIKEISPAQGYLTGFVEFCLTQ
jgi:hypothetical protein